MLIVSLNGKPVHGPGALQAAIEVTPVGEPLTLGKGDKWWHVPPRRARFRIDVMDDIGTERFLAPGVSDVVAARRLTEYLQHYFMEEGQQHA